jgi:septal ring factor EnvC (AmiA/AmiB activator)
MKRVLFIPVLLAGLLIYATTCWGQTPFKAQQEMQARLEETLKRHDQTSRALFYTKQELGSLEESLGNTRELLVQLEEKEIEIATRLMQVMPQLKALEGDVDQGEQVLANRLRALYLYGPDLSLWRLASARDFHDALTRSVALTRLAKLEKQRLAELNQRRHKLATMRHLLDFRQKELKQIKSDRIKQTQVLSSLLAKRQRLLPRLVEEQKAQEDSITALREALIRLARTFDLDNGEPDEGPKPESQAAKAAPKTSEKAKPKTSPESKKPRLGVLSPPVDGQVAGPAGPGGRGLLVQARAQASVRSPWYGRVVYAGVMAGYGHLIVVDHGERIHSVLGYLGGVSVRPGKKVRPGSVVGYLDKSGQLYIEVRKDARPQNPRNWLRLNS